MPRVVVSPFRPLWVVAGIFWLAAGASAGAQAFDNLAEHLRRGEYELVVALAQQARVLTPEDESLAEMEAEALLRLGRFEEARALLVEATATAPGSLSLRVLRREAALQSGRSTEAELSIREVMQAIQFATALQGRDHVRSAEYQASLGEASLLGGLEPRLALENFLRPAQTGSAPARRAFLVAGRLALDKRDFALASRTFQSGLEHFPEDADLLWGLAASYLNGERRGLIETSQRALAVNPRHVPALLLLAEHLIDSEQPELARAQLERALAVNPHAPDAHALLAVLANGARDPVAAAAHRAEALAIWKNNPRVDHLIGRKLSHRYQFAEGAQAQRRALAADPSFTPARVQLAQDLLRLGQEDEGWALAAQAHGEDAYHVEAYNLTTLRDQLEAFTVLTTPHFRVRMPANEAPIYGDRVLALLERAHEHLTRRYALQLETPTTVEIYANPQDFAVRTFGMPDIGGFLGVCFGPVFTVNSPTSGQANWEAVMWHEFTHVITLSLTKNRMPRWLSEGISVFEEHEADARWHRRLSLNDRERIMSGGLRSIGDMSAAFLDAKDNRDTQFAYLQSGLVVEYLVSQHGFNKLRALLSRLRDNEEVNHAIAAVYGPIADLDSGFTAFAREKAAQVAPGYDLRRVDQPLAQLLVEHAPLLGNRPNLHARLADIRAAMKREDWASARAELEKLLDDGLYLTGSDNLHHLLARVCAAQGDTPGERAAWRTIAEREGDALEPVTRLLHFARADRDWAEVTRWAEAWLAVHPLAPTPWRALLEAHEASQQLPAVAHAGRVLLELDPPDYASIHFRVAKALAAQDPGRARRHALLALEDAPRFRAAYELLDTLPVGTSPTLSP